MTKKCLGYDENYKHCLTCPDRDGIPREDGKRMICYTKGLIHGKTMAKPCAECGAYYPGDCRCPQPCYCDSCNTERSIDEQEEDPEYDDLDPWGISPEDYWETY
ncbi:MAG: hypothetical protein ACFFD4_08050 [Candidatus Odinarchaeota archaeon]